MNELNDKLSDTLEVFTDIKNLYYYQEDTRGVLKKMYEHTLEVLSSPEIDVRQLTDQNGNNLLHLASDGYNLDYFLKAARKGINPYDVNLKDRNAFQSRHYDFPNILWKKLENLYFDSNVLNKSFSNITTGFHPLFKQTIFEKNIKNNTAQYKLPELIQFLKDNEIYSHMNVLLFAFEKYTGNVNELFNFIDKNKKEFSLEENSLALHCGIKSMALNKQRLEDSFLLENFMNHSDFSIDNNFLQSMRWSSQNYNNIVFQEIFHKQTTFLIDKKYDFKHKFDFYFEFPYIKNNKDIRFLDNLQELYKTLSLEPVLSYYQLKSHMNKQNSSHTNELVSKKYKI